MAAWLYRWFLIFGVLGGLTSFNHPIYVSVTEIEHNSTDKTLEISCKIFTDDFEKVLRNISVAKIDLSDPVMRSGMNEPVNKYIQQHLKVNVDGKNVQLDFLGFEQQEEGIVSYFQAENIVRPKKVIVKNNILYEYKSEQMGIVHVIVDGKRKSMKLSNPETVAEFEF